MSRTKEQILDEASALPDDDRIDLVEALLRTLDHTADVALSQAWQAEIARRREAVRTGAATTRPAYDVIDRLRRKVAGA